MLRGIELRAACVSLKVLVSTVRSIYTRVTFPLSFSRSVQTRPFAHLHCSGSVPAETSRACVPSSIGIIGRTVCCALRRRGKSVRGYVATGISRWVTPYCWGSEYYILAGLPGMTGSVQSRVLTYNAPCLDSIRFAEMRNLITAYISCCNTKMELTT
jgi:hypothetical protein